MNRFAIDAATFLHVARQERRPDPSHRLVAPNSLRTRALELLLTDVRLGRLDEPQALLIHERLTALKVRLLGDRVSRRTAWDLAIQHGWNDLEDAEHIAVAQLQADALVTINESLASRAIGLIPLASLDDLYS